MKITLNRFPEGRGADHACSFRRPLCPLAVTALLSVVAAVPAWCQAVPEFFGTYAVLDGKLAPMIGGRGDLTPGQTSLQIYNFQKMAGDTENVFVFEGGEVHFLVFDAAVADASASVELYKLPFARNLITRPDGLAQVGGLLNQIGGRGGQPQNSASPMQKYLVAKTDALKVELLQKPLSGQPQMVQLVPASKLEAGIYSLFAVRMQGGQQFIVSQLFELKSGPETPYCIDLMVTGGFGGAMDASDARMTRPYYLAKENYVACGASGAGASASVNPPVGGSVGGNTGGGGVMGGNAGVGTAPAVCNDYNACFQSGMNAYKAHDWPGAAASFQAAANQRATSGEPWVWLGRVLLRDGQRHRLDDLSQVWDKALSLGAEILIGACHEQTLRPCERGDLALSGKSVSFLAAGSRTIFSAAPGDIEPGRVLNNSGAAHISYSLKVAGKNYAVDFIPLATTNCTFNLMVQCPPEGISEQLILAQYVSQALPKLARGMEAR